MRVIVLMAGEGKRFREAGYRISKPFIDIMGKPMVERMTDSLPFLKDIPEENWWFAMRSKDYSNHTWALQEIYGKEINTFVFHKTTSGNLETAHRTALRMMLGNENARYDDLLILDCDNIFNGEGFGDFVRAKKAIEASFGALCHFKPIDETNHWCFALKGRGDIVESIEERSELLRESGADPVMGVWYFSSANLFKTVAEEVFNQHQPGDGELYMSQAMKELIKKKFSVYGFEVKDPEPIGTPEYLEEYKLRKAHGKIMEIREAVNSKKPKEKEDRKLRICIDIDGTINHTKKPDDKYGNELPQDLAPSTIREWKKRGHYIILHTARHMNTCSANVGQVVARIAKPTIEWLEKNNIPYDELHFGKPHADIFIDDAAYRHHNWLSTQKVVESLEKKGGRFSSEYHKITEENKKHAK